MRQIKAKPDERLSMFCIHCGKQPDNRDHVPSRILLDEPFPENLPVVDSCFACNEGFSADEEYLACLLECVVHGSTDPNVLSREKVKKVLNRKAALASRLESARKTSPDGTAFEIEHDRVLNIVLKLARGHASYETSEGYLDAPTSTSVCPLSLLTAVHAAEFETVPEFQLWPEIGSRAFHRNVRFAEDGWVVVQPGVYRYLVSIEPGMVRVRMVLHEYLAAEVVWD